MRVIAVLFALALVAEAVAPAEKKENKKPESTTALKVDAKAEKVEAKTALKGTKAKAGAEIDRWQKKSHEPGYLSGDYTRDGKEGGAAGVSVVAALAALCLMN